MHEFSEHPFIAGSLTGLRSFKVGPALDLTGCFRTEAWSPGINEAKCLRSTWMMPPAEWPHHIGQLHCTCGFYAYFDQDANPHHQPGNVPGLIEGFGTVTVGSRGFRASKARIVALIRDARPADDFNRIVALYPAVPTFPTIETALAEFPLTPVALPVSLRKRPPASPTGHWASAVAASAALSARAFADAMRELSQAMQQSMGSIAKLRSSIESMTDETPRQRALRLRRERNTGPAQQRGLDGTHRKATS